MLLDITSSTYGRKQLLGVGKSHSLILRKELKHTIQSIVNIRSHHPASQPASPPNKSPGMAQDDGKRKRLALSPQEQRFIWKRIREAKKKAHDRRPNNIASRWSRNIQGYKAGTGRDEYMTTSLYLVIRGAGGEGQQQPPYACMEAVDIGGDTVMCCCGGGDGPDQCRLRGFLGEKWEAWAWGKEVEVELTEGDVAFLRQAMMDSYVSTRNIEVCYE